MAQPAAKRFLTEANAALYYVPKWQPNTSYLTGTLVVAPTGQLVRASTDFISGTSYTASNWTVVAGALSSVAGRQGDVVLVKGDVGLGQVDNTPDASKPVSAAQQAALDLKANTSALAGKADLVGGVIPTAQIPSLALNTVVPVASRAAMLALTTTQVQPGDIAVDTSVGSTRGSYILLGPDPSQLSSWVLLNAPTDLVTSVNGQTGTVVLAKADVGLNNVDNTSDANKPVSTAQQQALDVKANSAALAPVATSGAYADLTGKPTASGATRYERRPAVGQWLLHAATSTGGSDFGEGLLKLGPLLLPPGTYDAVVASWSGGSAGAKLRFIGYADGTTPGPTGPDLLNAVVDASSGTSFAFITLPTPLVVPDGGLVLWAGAAPQGAASTRAQPTLVNQVGTDVVVALSGQYVSDSAPRAAVVSGVTAAAPTNPTFTWDRVYARIGLRRSA